MSATKDLVFAGVLRFCFLIYGEWQDKNLQVKYTDIDYQVYTDAAYHVLQGNSPYSRLTYRYTPLLAWMLIPNFSIHFAWGKLCFICGDLLTGYFISKMLHRMKLPSNRCRLSLTLWLFNPFTITISTRGNAESIISALVIGTLYCIQLKKIVLAGILYGTSVHFKIYPVLYCLPLYFSLHEKAKMCSNLNVKFLLMPTTARLKFALAAIFSFSTLFVTSYMLYGNRFLNETYLYHLTRKDTRHNFSLYFYFLYLTSKAPFSTIEVLVFLPQMVLMLIASLKFYSTRDLPMCFFVETFAFVTFNKVCTSQYFLWYICFLPLIIHHIKISWHQACLLMFLWLSTQALWLFAAYLLEFQNKNTFISVWIASILFFLSNIVVLSQLIKNYMNL